MEDSSENNGKVLSFVPQDPHADLVGETLSIYITKKEPKKEGFTFEGYAWSEQGRSEVKGGYITPLSINFVTLYEINQSKSKSRPKSPQLKRVSSVSRRPIIYRRRLSFYSESEVSEESSLSPSRSFSRSRSPSVSKSPSPNRIPRGRKPVVRRNASKTKSKSKGRSSSKGMRRSSFRKNSKSPKRKEIRSSSRSKSRSSKDRTRSVSKEAARPQRRNASKEKTRSPRSPIRKYSKSPAPFKKSMRRIVKSRERGRTQRIPEPTLAKDPKKYESYEFKGSFSVRSSMYYNENPQYRKMVAIKNQGVIFKPDRPPMSPFSLYSHDIFDEIKKENPNKKFTELKSLITQNWDSLDKEKKAAYQQKHAKLFRAYKESWRDPAKEFISDYKEEEKLPEEPVEESKKPLEEDISQTGKYLVHIFQSIKYNQNGRRFEYVTVKAPNPKNYWQEEKSWLNALKYVQEQYFKIEKQCEREMEKFAEMKYGVTYGEPKLEFQATIIDFAHGTRFAVSRSKLELELTKQIQSISQTKKYLIIDILREKDFSAQTIREVLSVLPKEKTSFGREAVSRRKRGREGDK